MGKVLDFLRKFNTPTVYGIICLIFGVAFIATPDIVLDIMMIVAGVFVLIIAILNILVDIDNGGGNPFVMFNVIRDVILVILGVTMISARSAFALQICTGLGVFIVIRSVLRVVRLTKYPKVLHTNAWWVDVVLTIVMIAIGLWLWFYPVFPQILAGIALIIIAIELLSRRHIKPKGNGNNNSNDFYINDFEDKSDYR